MLCTRSIATSATENSVPAWEAGGVFVSPGATESPAVIKTAAHGGVPTCPGSGGAQGGEFVSPAKVATAKTNVKVMETPSLFRLFMFSP